MDEQTGTQSDRAETHAEQLSKALQDVASGAGAESEHLAALSHLDPREISRFRAAWEPLAERQKLALLDVLSRDEADSLRLDYNPVYHLAMADASPAVRRRAVEATVEDDSAWLLDRLLGMLVEDDDADVRAASAAALRPFAQRAELGELSDEQARRVRETLFETVRRPGERIDVRSEALEAVGFFSDARARGELEAGFRDEATRLHALRGMGHSMDPDWLETVLGQFDDPDDLVRRAAAQAAGEIGEESAVEPLSELVDDPAIPVRLAAIAALGEIGGEEAREILVYALEDKREAVREAAEEALEQLDFFDDPLGA